MTPSLHALLQQVDTPTICNAIEVAQGKRGFNAFTRGTMLINEASGVIVGYASTAKIAALAPSTEAPDVIRARRMAYYKQMAEAPKPSVCVIEDEDVPNAIGAFWGEVNTTIHKGFGLAGVYVGTRGGPQGELHRLVAGQFAPTPGKDIIVEPG